MVVLLAVSQLPLQTQARTVGDIAESAAEKQRIAQTHTHTHT
jgi:hypothetical protein